MLNEPLRFLFVPYDENIKAAKAIMTVIANGEKLLNKYLLIVHQTILNGTCDGSKMKTKTKGERFNVFFCTLRWGFGSTNVTFENYMNAMKRDAIKLL